MMNLERFEKKLLELIAERLGSEYECEMEEMPRNNGARANGIRVRRIGHGAVGAVVYPQSFYDEYKDGRSLDLIADDMIRSCLEMINPIADTIPDLLDFDKVKDRIAYRLVNTKANGQLLRDHVSLPYLDLSIVFCVVFENGAGNFASALVKKTVLEKWGTSPEELMEIARKNTPAIFPAKLETMAEMLFNMSESLPGNEESGGIPITAADSDFKMWVLTNERSLYGACTILYPDIVKRLSRKIRSDLAILPSSVHEVIIVPAPPGADFSEMRAIVTSINGSLLNPDEVLSDSVYVYSLDADLIRLAA